MREITDHKLNGSNALNDALKVQALDEPGQGGACQHYRITNDWGIPVTSAFHDVVIHFQKGNPQEVGINGISNEALLTVLIDRLTGFVNGPFQDPDTVDALNDLDSALQNLQRRTRDRLERGVEGTNQK